MIDKSDETVTEPDKKAKKNADETSSTTEKEFDDESSTAEKDADDSSSTTEKEADTSNEDVAEKEAGQSPSEGATAGGKAGNTLTEGKMTGQGPDVFVPPSNIPGKRNASGKTPGQESYSGKSVNPDLQKSPLYVELAKNIDSLKGAFSKKLEAVEKSTQARFDNIEQLMKKMEKFYSQPFYKAVKDEPVAITGNETFAEKASKGNVKFSGQ